MMDDEAYKYARNLLFEICHRDCPEKEVEALDDTIGVLTQIDHMTAHLFSRIEELIAERDAARDAAVPADLEEAGKVLEGVTPGPWTEHGKGKHPHPFVCGATESYEHGEDQPVVAYVVGMNDTANRRFIAWAREGVPALIALATAQAALIAERAALAALLARGVKVPEGWHMEQLSRGNGFLFYTLRQDGWRKGEPIMVNDVTIRLEPAPGSEADLEPIAAAILAALAQIKGDE